MHLFLLFVMFVFFLIGSKVFPIEKDYEGSVDGKLEKHCFADNVLVQSGRGVVRGVGHSIQSRRIHTKSMYTI